MFDDDREEFGNDTKGFGGGVSFLIRRGLVTFGIRLVILGSGWEEPGIGLVKMEIDLVKIGIGMVIMEMSWVMIGLLKIGKVS